MQQKLMRDLETKERELNKLKAKADGLLKANHPASDKIEVNSGPDLLKPLAATPFEYRRFFCPCTGLQGHSADAVELAAADHQVH